MKSITLLDRITGETVTFQSLAEAAKELNVKVGMMSNLSTGVQRTMLKKRYMLAPDEPVTMPKGQTPPYRAEEPSKELYWRIYNSL